ncbi:MAG: molybdopterin molybdotransferase MoeA [Deltaproteobacteria bacterium]|nr:molybdopterin molybdotransferase MoeA [Deltaproteobacteria bacterium]MBW2395296.1 molybdopterin molybdotransferase MoeA [Deltaproteobacteria bacterium]
MKTGISVEEARRIVLEAATPLPAEIVPASGALGRVLAESVDSDRTLPPADCSAMDGYAVRAEDLAGASTDAPCSLAVVYEVAAGGRGERPLQSGETARIFTGAPVPAGADTVVRQEDTDRAGERVAIRVASPRGEHIRVAGGDVSRGDLVLQPGARIGPAEIGMLASLGRTLVHVHRRPRVAIASGGDELIQPDGDPSGGRIVASNAYSLAAQCEDAGATTTNLGIAGDTKEDLARVFRAGLSADLLVSSAGVSVGDHDHVRAVLEELGGQMRFWGVRMKPGYPLAFGRIGEQGAWVFGLPGNPVSAMVTFEQFVRPVLMRMGGHEACFRPVVTAVLAEPLTKKPGRLHFVRVHLKHDGERILASSTGDQGSGVLRSMTLAQGLLVFPADTTALAAGDEVRVQVLDETFFRTREPLV